MYDISTAIFSENKIFENTYNEMKEFSEVFFSQNVCKLPCVVYNHKTHKL